LAPVSVAAAELTPVLAIKVGTPVLAVLPPPPLLPTAPEPAAPDPPSLPVDEELEEELLESLLSWVPRTPPRTAPMMIRTRTGIPTQIHLFRLGLSLKPRVAGEEAEA
jgi:hypothetical protein